MSTIKKTLLLIGSPHLQNGSSESLGAYLQTRLQEKGISATRLAINPTLAKKDEGDELWAAVSATDLLILSYPLYVDTLPALTIEALQIIAERRSNSKSIHPLAFTALANCGFPEAYHCANSLRICEKFAKETGITWLGGLALGMGGMIGGNTIDEHGMYHNIATALDQAAEKLASRQMIPESAIHLMAKNMIPPVFYRTAANINFRSSKKQNKATEDINFRPYQKKEKDA